MKIMILILNTTAILVVMPMLRIIAEFYADKLRLNIYKIKLNYYKRIVDDCINKNLDIPDSVFKGVQRIEDCENEIKLRRGLCD